MTIETQNQTRQWAKWLLPFYLIISIPLSAAAQGIPFIQNYSAIQYKAHNQNFDIITGDEGTVYVANFEGLLYYNHSEWRILHTPGITRITAVFRDSNGTIWTGGYNYVGYVEKDKLGRLTLHSLERTKVFQGEVHWIWEKQGHIYFLASDDKIYQVINNNVVWAAGEHLPSNGFSVFAGQSRVTQIQQLENGEKAVSTNGDGLIIVDAQDREIMRITEANGLCSNNVSHITYDKFGTIWGATDNGIFAIAYPSIYTRFTSHEGLHGEVVTIKKMGNHIYAGTLSGLYRLNGSLFEMVGQLSYACWQLQLQGQNLLAATSDGIFRITPDNKVQQLTTANTLSLLPDGNSFYSGEMDGIYLNTPSGRKKISDIEKVIYMYKDKQGTIWLQNLYGKIWRAFQPYSASKDPDAISTLVDMNGTILPMTTSTTQPFPYPAFSYTDLEGVTWLTNSKSRKIYAYYNGKKDEELSENVYPLMDLSIRAMLRDKNTLWIGGDKGINIIDYTRQEILKNTKPVLKIRTFTMNGDSILWGGYGKCPTTLPDLPSSVNNISISYSIEHSSLLLLTQYRYRMNNHDWSPWSTETQEDFVNLPHGNYNFEVQARDAFGQLSDPVSISFAVQSPLYLRWWMILLYILLGLLSIQRFLRWRTQRLEKEKHNLESIVQMRTAEVVKQKDEIEEKSRNLEKALHDLGEAQDELVRQEKMATVGKLTQGLIDRILNPLNYINNFAKLSEGLVNDVRANIEDEEEHIDKENYEDTMDVLDMLKGNLQKVGEHGANTSRTLKAMEEMLKDRTGGIVKMSLTTLLHQNEAMLKKYFEQEIAQYHISTVFEIPEQEIDINGNAEQLSKTFMSLLGNSIYAVVKKAQRKQYSPEVKLKALVKEKEVIVTFRDNGIGIESTIIDKIFDPFFTTKTTGEASGVGLYLSREIVQNHNGDISVQSQKDEFTEFTITLPTL